MIKVFKFKVISPIYEYHVDDIILATYTQQDYGLRLFNGSYGNEQVLWHPSHGKIGAIYFSKPWLSDHFELIDEIYVTNKKELRDFINDKDNYKV